MQKLSAAENKQALLHPDRIREITEYILVTSGKKPIACKAVLGALMPCLP